MSIRLSRPTFEDLGALIEEARTAPLTYDQAGMAAFTDVPAGYRLDRWSRLLGQGTGVFGSACDGCVHGGCTVTPGWSSVWTGHPSSERSWR